MKYLTNNSKLSGLQENPDRQLDKIRKMTHEHIENINEEIDMIKKIESLVLNNITELKNSPERFNHTLD